MIAFLSDDVEDDFDEDDFDEDDEMDPDEVLRIATNLLGYDPSTVDQETLKRDIYALLDNLARRLAEI